MPIKIVYTGEKQKPVPKKVEPKPDAKKPTLNFNGNDKGKGPTEKIWDPNTTPIRAYELAKAGLPDRQIAMAIGVTHPTFCGWLKTKPSLVHALERGRTSSERNGVATFLEYCYGRLTPELKDIWEEVVELNKREAGDKRNGVPGDPSASVFLRNLMHGQPKRARQHLWIHAYVDCNFNASEACRATYTSKAALDSWMEEPEFQKLIGELDWHMQNLFEGCLVDLVVNEKDPSATIFVAKTKLRTRGYNEKVEMQVNHNHQHNHNHTHVSVESLDLPLEMRKAMLEAYRSKQKALKEPPRQVEALPAHEDNEEGK